MKRSRMPITFLFLLVTISYPGVSHPASMYDYCQVPPYVIQNVPPNVMVLEDISGSMLRFAYYDGFHTDNNSGDDNLCADTTNPCTGFADPGAYPGYKYYGYFNPDAWYEYGANRFYETGWKSGSGVTGQRNKFATEWDGSFLNWLTMRRVDVVRKVLTGGKTVAGEGAGFDRLSAEVADCDGRGKYKRITNAPNYMPDTYNGTRKIYVLTNSAATCNGGGAGTSSLQVRNDSGGGEGSGGDTFNVAVRTPIPVEGVLQAVVGTKARVGVSFYNVNTGAYVQVAPAAASLASAVYQLNLTRPNANSPMAESAWTMTGYFAQQASALSGPGPRYAPGDYQISNNADPLNFGSGGAPRWPYCAKNFVLVLTDGEPCADGNLPAALANYATGRSDYNCVNGVGLDGMGLPTVAGACPSAPRVKGGVSDPFPADDLAQCFAGNYTAGLEDVTLWAHTTDLRNNPTIGVDNVTGMQNLTFFIVSAFGKGSTFLRYAAINGGFEDNGSHVPGLQSQWDGNADGEPDTYFEATDGYELQAAVEDALSSILKRASSGTAASVLASGEGSGANIVQAVFYPRRRFGNDIINWTGMLQNLWFYVDPFFANSSIREDNSGDTAPYTQDYKLDLGEDYIAQLYFDTTLESTRARRWKDTDGDGDADLAKPTVEFESLASLWEAGKKLWSRDISSSPRTIFTTLDGSTRTDFTTTYATALASSLQAADSAAAEKIIRFTHGEDIVEDLVNNSSGAAGPDGLNDWRLRTVTIGTDTRVWKLGDIVNSTPRISSWVPLNTYDKIYFDQTYKAFVDNTLLYRPRGMAFSGGNDGMLHAFKLGNLKLSWSGQGALEKAWLANDNTAAALGHEMWAFIPRNALPYLKYAMDPDYCHLFMTDLTPYVFDASVGGSSDTPDDVRTAASWRTILIGGMRTGGACRNLGDSCTDCVKTPVDGVGYSSYFALDVTNQNAPVLLWEFSDPGLGFATTGPAVVRISARTDGAPDRTKNGHWYVVLGSGPTGPIDNTDLQFLGKSDQGLKFFVLDLKSGDLLRTIDNTAVPFGFAGSMLNSTADMDLDYQDDAVYVGYTKRTGSSPNYSWTQGGVGRIVTREDTNSYTTHATIPNGWVWSKVIDDVGTVTSGIARLQNNIYHTSWLYFGTGRYFFEQETTVDDGAGQRSLFGVKEPCFTSINTLNPDCTSTVNAASLNDVSADSAGATAVEDAEGWKINLDPSSTLGTTSTYYTYDNVTRPYRAERVITDTVATTSGLVFFTTYKPYADECGIGGKSFIWVTKYNTGGAPALALLRGKALVQVSTASVEQIDLSEAFSGSAADTKGGRRSSALEGVPPTAQGLSLLSPPPPVNRILHQKER